MERNSITLVKHNMENLFDNDKTGNLWTEWELKCLVPPVRFALVNLNKPYDLAQAAQVSLATTIRVPHIAFEMVGVTMDFADPKVALKVASWNIDKSLIETIPRRINTLANIKNQGFRLVATVASSGKSALDYQWQNNDVIVIGGANGLSKSNLSLMDDVITIPCSLPFLTTPTVIPVLSYNLLQKRGLWNHGNSK